MTCFVFFFSFLGLMFFSGQMFCVPCFFFFWVHVLRFGAKIPGLALFFFFFGSPVLCCFICQTPFLFSLRLNFLICRISLTWLTFWFHLICLARVLAFLRCQVLSFCPPTVVYRHQNTTLGDFARHVLTFFLLYRGSSCGTLLRSIYEANASSHFVNTLQGGPLTLWIHCKGGLTFFLLRGVSAFGSLLRSICEANAWLLFCVSKFFFFPLYEWGPNLGLRTPRCMSRQEFRKRFFSRRHNARCLLSSVKKCQKKRGHRPGTCFTTSDATRRVEPKPTEKKKTRATF